MLYYDYLLTLPVEIETYWKGRPSKAAWFYFCNRCLGIIGTIPVMVQFYLIRNQTVRTPWSSSVYMLPS